MFLVITLLCTQPILLKRNKFIYNSGDFLEGQFEKACKVFLYIKNYKQIQGNCALEQTQIEFWKLISYQLWHQCMKNFEEWKWEKCVFIS